MANDPLEAAFAVAFPSGAKETDANGSTMTFTAMQLVPVVSDGSVQALISEGSLGDDAAHVQTGDLRVTYLNSSGDEFKRPNPRIQENLDGDGFGQPPQWKLIHIRGKPAIRVEYGYTDQGCTDTTIKVFILEPSGVHLDQRASKPMKEVCDSTSDAGDDSNTDSPATADSTASTSGDTPTATPATTDSSAPQ